MRAHTKRHTVNSQPRRPDRWIHHQRVSYSEQFLFSLVYSLHYLLFYFVWLTFKRYLRWTTTFVLMHGIFVASLYVCRLLRLQLKEMRREEKLVKQSSHKSRTRSLGIRFQKVFPFIDLSIGRRSFREVLLDARQASSCRYIVSLRTKQKTSVLFFVI